MQADKNLITKLENIDHTDIVLPILKVIFITDETSTSIVHD